MHFAGSAAAPVTPWGFNPVAVEAIATTVAAAIAAIALVVAARTYVRNSRAAARRQATLVTANRMARPEPMTMGGVEHYLLEIEITNASGGDVYNLTLLMQNRGQRGDMPRPPLEIGHSEVKEARLVGRSWGRWTLTDGAAIPPGVSTLRVWLPRKQFSRMFPIQHNVAVLFVDRDGRRWTRFLSGRLREGWRSL